MPKSAHASFRDGRPKVLMRRFVMAGEAGERLLQQHGGARRVPITGVGSCRLLPNSIGRYF
jgi:hypothetical protein